ncbi:hypothetical protein ASD75_06065 [Acidovorax sp. Root568]|nr:hypothetical protein ASD75_06065 [Acidovorax sp. Root568]
MAKRRLYLTLTAIGGWRLSQIRRSLQNTNTEVNKPIQIQNSLAKSTTCAACIDMDRSFLASSTGMLPMGGPNSPICSQLL